MEKKGKTKNMFALALVITVLIILAFIIFSFIYSYLSKDNNELLNNDKSKSDSLASTIGKPVRSYSDKNTNDIYDEDLGRTGEFCNETEFCGICKECDESINKCVEIDDNIDPGYCEEGIYEGTLQNGEFFCMSGICAVIECIPSCTRIDSTIKQCGPDGCGGSCGECEESQYCDINGYCKNVTADINSRSQQGTGEKSDNTAKITLNKYIFNSICKICPNNDSYYTQDNQAINICCDENEECYYNKQKNFPPFCNANQNNPKKNYIICKGENDYSDLSKWCSNDLTYCSLVNKGIPECIVKENLIVGNPSYSKTTSIYLIRDKDSFTLNGISYVIKPHITYRKPIKISLNTNFYPDNYETFKYDLEEDIFTLCNMTLIKETKKEIDISGGKISLDNFITIEIPYNAMSNNTEISILRYNLSNCKINNNDKLIYNILDTLIINKSQSTENQSESPKKNSFPYLIVISILAFIIGVGFLYYKLVKNYKQYEKLKKENKEKNIN